MKLYVNLFSFVSVSDYKENGIAAKVAFKEKVYKEDDTYFFERNGDRVEVKTKNGLVVHKHMQIPLDDKLITKLK